MAARIVAITTYLPERRETVDAVRLEQPEWPVAKIAEKTGILERRLAAPDQTAGDMAYEAGRILLARDLVSTSDIDYLLYCTQSPDYPLPSTSCILQHRLGLSSSAGAFDFQLGCSGYVYGLQLANSLVASGDARHILLLTSDTYTKYIHPRDRTVRMLFGDGATATLIRKEEHGPSDIGRPSDIGPFVLGTDGAGAESLMVPAGGFRLPHTGETAREYVDASGCVRSKDHLYMDGQAVFSFAISRVPQLVAATLERAQLTVSDIDWFVYHQANRFMLENLAMCSHIPPEKMLYHLEMVGNTVSSSIPMTLDAHVEAGRIRPGHRLLLVGFGVGYSWGACVVRWR